MYIYIRRDVAGTCWATWGGGKYPPFVRPLPPPLPTHIASTGNGHKPNPFSTAWPHSPLHGPILHCTAPICTARPHSTLHGPILTYTALTPTPPPSHSHLPAFSLPPLCLLTPTFPPSHSHPSAFSLPPSRLLTRSRLDAHTSGNLKKADYFPPRGLRGIVSFERRVPATFRHIYIYMLLHSLAYTVSAYMHP